MRAKDDADASNVTQTFAGFVGGLVANSEVDTDKESNVEHPPSEKSAEDDDRVTPLPHANVGLDRQRLDSVADCGCRSQSPASLCVGVHGWGRVRGAAVARVAPGTTAAPAQGATPAAAGEADETVGGRGAVSFPSRRGCSNCLK